MNAHTVNLRNSRSHLHVLYCFITSLNTGIVTINACRLQFLPQPEMATSRLAQAPLHPAFQHPGPSRSEAPEWRDRCRNDGTVDSCGFNRSADCRQVSRRLALGKGASSMDHGMSWWPCHYEERDLPNMNTTSTSMKRPSWSIFGIEKWKVPLLWHLQRHSGCWPISPVSEHQ